MLKNLTINIKVVEKVAIALEELNREVVFIGGAVVSLYVTDEGAEQPRPTKDIDIAVQVSSYFEMDQLRQLLAQKKIYPAASEKMMYRYVYDDILIDFIPFETTSLGPTNSWLKPGIEKAYFVTIGEVEIKILPVSLFLATKWEAYKSRGGDPRTSHDFEDIIYVIDNNLNLVKEVQMSDQKVKHLIKSMSNEIIEHRSLHEIIECHINPIFAEERREMIIDKLKAILEV